MIKLKPLLEKIQEFNPSNINAEFNKVADICEKQNSVNQEILITLSSIKTDLIYVKKATGARGN
jgi:hypothetical protein